VISKFGFVGVHFTGLEPLVRYAMVFDWKQNPEFKARFEKMMSELKPVYE
jgi:hypothetical protein